MSVIYSRTTGFAASGPSILTRSRYETNGAVYWVDSVTGSDSNAGTREELPKATVFGASGAIASVTTAQSDLVICKATHVETVSSAYSSSKAGFTLVSLGSGTSRARFTSSVAGVMITLSGNYVRLDNLYFAASTAATTSRVTLSGAGSRIRDCQFNIGASDYTDNLIISGTSCRALGCTFTVTATASSGTSQYGLRGTGAGNYVEDCVFDGGAYGWSSGIALSVASGVDQWMIENTTLSNYSYIGVTSAASFTQVSGITADATSGVKWTEA